jgi:long-chain acyl-CoA synthetase
MGHLKKYTVPAMLQYSFSNFERRQSLVFAGEEDRSYVQLEEEISRVVRQLLALGITKGDKVAILSINMPNWGIAYFAVATIGAIVVPILPDFSVTEISNIIEHSESKAIFVSDSLAAKVEQFKRDSSKVIIRIETFEIISGRDSVEEMFPENIPFTAVEEDDLLSIIYTSGTTGKSKGVMLTHKNIVWDAEHCSLIHPVSEKDRFLSLLPLSHTYENTIGLIYPIMYGSSVHYLRKPPTPSVLVPAMQMVKPTIMLTVPLIIEKIYYKQILPNFNKNGFIRSLYHFLPVRLLLNRIAGKKLMKTFGGELVFFGVGGAKLNETVEKFLLEAGFPYSIGFGITEAAPLIAGAGPGVTRLGAVGPAMPGDEVIINQPDPKTGEGEVWVKGPNVMKGYYKEPELTKEVITEDGWFKTGDLGVFDRKGYLVFKGRLKNVIVSASGENIYPEEIESVINNFRNVVESLVVERKGKLIALVRLNVEELEAQYKAICDQADLFNEKLEELIKELHLYVNSRVSKFSQVQHVLIHTEPFQRTPTLKIKRFLYV